MPPGSHAKSTTLRAAESSACGRRPRRVHASASTRLPALLLLWEARRRVQQQRPAVSLPRTASEGTSVARGASLRVGEPSHDRVGSAAGGGHLGRHRGAPAEAFRLAHRGGAAAEGAAAAVEAAGAGAAPPGLPSLPSSPLPAEQDPAVSRMLRLHSAGRWYELLGVRRTANAKAPAPRGGVGGGGRAGADVSCPLLAGAARGVPPTRGARAPRQDARPAGRRLSHPLAALREASRARPRRDHRADRAFTALRETYNLLSDAGERRRYDSKLAAEAAKRRKRRQEQRALAWRGCRRLGHGVAVFAARNKRVSVAVLLVITLLFRRPPGADPPSEI